MKKLLSLLIISPLLFLSCEKRDNNNSPNPILGTWKIENYTTNYFEGYIDPVLGTEVITDLEVYDGPEEGEEQYLNFTDNNALLNYYYYDDTLAFIDTMSYIKTGNALLVDSNVVFTITELTNTNFSYSLVDPGETGPLENDTLYFYRATGSGDMVRSETPSLINHQLKQYKSAKTYNSFFNKRECR